MSIVYATPHYSRQLDPRCRRCSPSASHQGGNMDSDLHMLSFILISDMCCIYRSLSSSSSSSSASSPPEPGVKT
ncbi:hypothetical protein SprV_0100248600 [Sparganum proliferum]